MHAHECTPRYDEAASRLAPKRRNGRFDLYIATDGRIDQLDLE
jgi:hypothetical protein